MVVSQFAAVRIAIGVVCFFGFGLTALLFLYAVNPWVERVEIPFFGSGLYDTVLFGVTGVLSAFTCIRLIQSKPWAWWAAFAVSVIMLGLGVLLIVTTLSTLATILPGQKLDSDWASPSS